MKYALSSHIGMRMNNEDAIGMQSDGSRSCFVLCDGVGGHRFGEVASALVKETILEDFMNYHEEDFIDYTIKHAQDVLTYRKQVDHAYDGMMTTLVLLLIDGDYAQYAHIGDSRLYHFEGEHLMARTIDHSVAQMLVLTGDLKERQIRRSPDRSTLLRAMGMEWDNQAYEKSERFAWHQETSFLLCSDGFWEPLHERAMIKALKKNDCEGWLEEMNTVIEKKIKKQNNADNYSAIVVKMGENEHEM